MEIYQSKMGRRRLGLLVSLAAALLAPRTVLAADDMENEIDAVLAQDAEPSSDEGDATDDKRLPNREELPQIGEDSLAVFVLQRGFFVATDLGVFLTLGGVQGNSNAQPYMSLKAGFDIGDYLSLQLSLSSGYASGNPVSDNDDVRFRSSGRAIKDYELLGFGLEGVASIRPTKRFAIEPKVGFGATRLSPEITVPTDPTGTQTIGPLAPHVVAGLDLNYLTLLTDFCAGITIDTYYIFRADILALAAGAVVRYTF